MGLFIVKFFYRMLYTKNCLFILKATSKDKTYAIIVFLLLDVRFQKILD